MANIGLVSCVSSKEPHPTKASSLYTSALFRKAKAYIEGNCDAWFILSAKHGLVHPDEVIAPYEKTLNRMNRDARKTWAQQVLLQLSQIIKPGDTVTFIAGMRYREFLLPSLRDRGITVSVPLLGKSIGHQLQWLSRQSCPKQRLQHLERFYALLKQLEQGVGGKRLMAACSGATGWPTRGVYFFFEPGEYRRVDRDNLRVVRVGTHGVSAGSKSTLWTRLRTHRGTDEGTGNHRSSIFRLHVGASIIARSGIDLTHRTWGLGQSAEASIRETETSLEQEASKYICSMSILWVAINDAPGPTSDRAYIERNAIGLLAGPTGSVDTPSSNWLGLYSPRPSIRTSGLWNLDHINFQYDPQFLDVLEKYVKITTGSLPTPNRSLAPRNWYKLGKKGVPRNQLMLFDRDSS